MYLNVPIHFNVNGICHTNGPRCASGSGGSEVSDDVDSVDHRLGSA